MQTVGNEKARFTGVPEAGLTAFWYPNGRKDKRTQPMIAIINNGWTLGIADLSVLPVQDGAIRAVDQVWHITDPRLRDMYGNISPGGEARGCWEYTPISEDYLSRQEPKVEEKTKAKAKA